MKKKITAVFLCALLLFVGGICVAYYNTRNFGFDENATVFSYDDEKVTFLDFDIYYKDVDVFLETTSNYFPDTPLNCEL